MPARWPATRGEYAFRWLLDPQIIRGKRGGEGLRSANAVPSTNLRLGLERSYRTDGRLGSTQVRGRWLPSAGHGLFTVATSRIVRSGFCAGHPALSQHGL